MTKENNEDHDEKTEAAAISDTGKAIKKGMDRYEARKKSAAEGQEAPPAGDSTRSEE